MAELQVSKKSIGELFGSNLMQGKKFIVPEYQREYSWKALEQSTGTMRHTLGGYYRSFCISKS